jgi:hypothetical protein
MDEQSINFIHDDVDNNINNENWQTTMHYYNSWFFNRFYSKKNIQNDKHKKIALSIWTYQHDWVINSDLVILTCNVIYKMTNYLVRSNLYIN